MSNAPATHDETAAPSAVREELATPHEVLHAVNSGDLSKLTTEQRVLYYRQRCKIAGLDWRTQPFDWILLDRKLTFYAKKEAASGLIAVHKLKVELADGFLFENTDREQFRVKARVVFPDGRTVENIGLVSTAGLAGKALENACMKAATKATRRTVLMACGLGLLDESELEGLQTAPATPSIGLEYEDVPGREQEEFRKWLNGRVEHINTVWADHWTNKQTGEVPPDIKDLVSYFQLSGHLLKWAVEAGYLSEKPSVNATGRDKICTRLWMDHFPEVRDEVRQYAIRLGQEFKAKLAGQGLSEYDDGDDTVDHESES